MKPDPYIGVSGVINPDQQKWIEETIYSSKTNRSVLLGVKAVDKNHYLGIKNKYGTLWYPVGEDIGEALKTSESSLCVPQVYLDYKAAAERGEAPGDYEEKFLNSLYIRCEEWINGIQFDMLPWMNASSHDLLRNIKEVQGENFRILVQCYGEQMNEYSPTDIAAELSKLEGIIDYVLFDSSHGTGRTLDTERLQPFVEKASELDWLGVGIAGGLDGPTIREHLPKLFQNYPDLSFDAEGRLHGPDGSLDKEVVEDYLRASIDSTMETEER